VKCGKQGSPVKEGSSLLGILDVAERKRLELKDEPRLIYMEALKNGKVIYESPELSTNFDVSFRETRE
jgi:hypothetical protein